ncbi:MAG TPA: ferrous iron transport protein A [Arcobacter sp.]|nr:ferrous iron transport protein A [Arcobacter sp.]HIP55773.1 ferrous iron transport protein A [Arcobacter sp.]
MKLSDLQINQSSVVTKISCVADLKQRFYSFGITKGATIMVEAISLTKNTMEINVEDTSIGIRVEEANTIEVKDI